MASTQETIDRIAAFYSDQADYYHQGTYQHPESEARYMRLHERCQTLFADRDVLEIACGTGYWTGVVATCARSVLATDVNENLVEITRERTRALNNVQCQVANAYLLDNVAGSFSGAYAQHWLSHVPKRQLRAFLDNLHSKLDHGARLLFSDNMIYHHPETVQRRVDEHGDIYEERLRFDGSRAETLKNFPTERELISLIEDVADDIAYQEYQAERLWTLSYSLR